MSEHSPEPWSVFEPSDPRLWPGIDSDRTGVVVLYGSQDDRGGIRGGWSEKGRANARRIVACVNACRGLTDEQLERGVVAKPETVTEVATPAGWTPKVGDKVHIRCTPAVITIDWMNGDSIRGSMPGAVLAAHLKVVDVEPYVEPQPPTPVQESYLRRRTALACLGYHVAKPTDNPFAEDTP
jgi:hypothetical protein